MTATSRENILKLRKVILDYADKICTDTVNKARSEAENCVMVGKENLQREIVQYAEESAKNVLQAKKCILDKTKRTEAEKTRQLCNVLLNEACDRLLTRLTALRQENGYIDIICGMAHEAAEILKTDAIVLSLAKEDLTLKDSLLVKLKTLLPDTDFTVCDAPALIAGGVIADAVDSKKQVCNDWKSVIERYSGNLATRLMLYELTDKEA